MGSVECVTFQGPESHDRRGGVRDGEAAVEGRDEGARSVAMVRIEMAVCLWCVGWDFVMGCGERRVEAGEICG